MLLTCDIMLLKSRTSWLICLLLVKLVTSAVTSGEQFAASKDQSKTKRPQNRTSSSKKPEVSQESETFRYPARLISKPPITEVITVKDIKEPLSSRAASSEKKSGKTVRRVIQRTVYESRIEPESNQGTQLTKSHKLAKAHQSFSS